RFQFRKVEPEMLCDEQTQLLAVGQLSGLSRGIADEDNVPIRDIDAALLGSGAGDKVARVKRSWMTDEVVLHHLEIGRVLLSHAFMTWLKEKDARRVPDGVEADRMQSVVHESCMFNAMSAATSGDELGAQSFGIQPDGAAEKDIEDLEGDARDVGRKNSSQS